LIFQIRSSSAMSDFQAQWPLNLRATSWHWSDDDDADVTKTVPRK
jgi:hypothetical protein